MSEAIYAAALNIKNRLKIVEDKIDTYNAIKAEPKKKSGCEYYIAEKTGHDMSTQFDHLQKEARAAKRKDLNQKYRAEFKNFDDATKDEWAKKAETAPPRVRKAPTKGKK
jgi:hypothetical protein